MFCPKQTMTPIKHARARVCVCVCVCGTSVPWIPLPTWSQMNVEKTSTRRGIYYSHLSFTVRPGPTKPLKVACDGHRKLFSPLYKNGLKKGSVRPCTWMSASPASHAELRGKNALEMFGPCTSQKVASMRMTVRPPRLGKNTSQALLHCTTWTGYAR